MSKEPVFKDDKTGSQRLRRLLGSVFDPRNFLHGLKVLNYLSYTNAAEVRRIKRGKRLRISPVASFANGQNIELGDDVRIGANVSVWAGPGKGRIVIGADSMIAPNVMLTAANYRFDDGTPVNRQPMDEGDIIIGRDVWIGANAVILPGVQIGDYAIIGAGAVVRDDIPERGIVVGNPGKVIGRRSLGSADGGQSAASFGAEPSRDVLEWLGANPTTGSRDLTRPLEEAGLDSFDLITLRAEIEQAFAVQISDQDWSAITALEDIARLSILTNRTAGQTQRKTPERTAPPLPAVPLSAEEVPTEAGVAQRRLALNMPQMALAGLSEAWMFKELGDLHWEMITRFLGKNSRSITDDTGARLYATFTRIGIDVENGLRAFQENDELAIGSTLDRYGASFFFGNHEIGAPNATLRARTMSTFAKYGERGNNTSLMKGAPLIPDPESLPSLETFPDFGIEYRSLRAQPEERTPIFECEYEQLGPHDINGVGLLYFAAYPIIFDICVGRFEGRDFLLTHTTVHKDVCYFANAEPTETLLFRLYEREEAEGVICYVASISRKSDDARMALIRGGKRFVGLHVAQ